MLWQDEVDYEAFSINIDPDDIPQLKSRMDRVFATSGAIETLQRGVKEVQVMMGPNENRVSLMCSAKRLNHTLLVMMGPNEKVTDFLVPALSFGPKRRRMSCGPTPFSLRLGSGDFFILM